MRYTEEDVDRVAEAICNADTTSWKNTDDTQTLPDVTWAEMRDDTDHIPYEGISLGRDHYRGMARAALEAMEREPITTALRRLDEGATIRRVLPLRAGGYEATITVPTEPIGNGWYEHEDVVATGATIDEAIRNAIAVAQEGR